MAKEEEDEDDLYESIITLMFTEHVCKASVPFSAKVNLTKVNLTDYPRKQLHPGRSPGLSIMLNPELDSYF